MDAKRWKLADLDFGGVYWILGYLPLKGDYGDTYIIKCKAAHNDEIFTIRVGVI